MKALIVMALTAIGVVALGLGIAAVWASAAMDRSGKLGVSALILGGVAVALGIVAAVALSEEAK